VPAKIVDFRRSKKTVIKPPAYWKKLQGAGSGKGQGNRQRLIFSRVLTTGAAREVFLAVTTYDWPWPGWRGRDWHAKFSRQPAR